MIETEGKDFKINKHRETRKKKESYIKEQKNT